MMIHLVRIVYHVWLYLFYGWCWFIYVWKVLRVLGWWLLMVGEWSGHSLFLIVMMFVLIEILSGHMIVLVFLMLCWIHFWHLIHLLLLKLTLKLLWRTLMMHSTLTTALLLLRHYPSSTHPISHRWFVPYWWFIVIWINQINVGLENYLLIRIWFVHMGEGCMLGFLYSDALNLYLVWWGILVLAVGVATGFLPLIQGWGVGCGLVDFWNEGIIEIVRAVASSGEVELLAGRVGVPVIRVGLDFLLQAWFQFICIILLLANFFVTAHLYFFKSLSL